MPLDEQEQIDYFANVISLVYEEEVVSSRKLEALEEVRIEFGAEKNTLALATKAVEAGRYVMAPLNGFSASVRNLSEMLYVCFVDGYWSDKQKQIIEEFSSRVGLTDDQFELMVTEAAARANRSKVALICSSCSTPLTSAAKFCPNCGLPLGKKEDESIRIALDIPNSGYAVEFCDFTAGEFPAALQYAKTAASFSSCIMNRKAWYLAAWAEEDFSKVVALAMLLNGLRNKKCYHNGAEIVWGELFGFTYCAESRTKSDQLVEYCFGKDENRLNPWGCKQARLDWTEHAAWLSYGRFERSGFLKRTRTWVFDKARIHHELMTALHPVRHCPHLQRGHIDAVLDILPNEIEIVPDGPWKFSKSYEEAPGSIKIVEVEPDNYEFKNEYFADGVRPNGIGILPDILRKAFAKTAGLRDDSN